MYFCRYYGGAGWWTHQRMYGTITNSVDDWIIMEKILEMSLSVLMHNCLNFIKENTLLQTIARKTGYPRGHIIRIRTPKCHPSLLVKSLSTPGCVQVIITENYHWIRIKVRKNFKILCERPYQETALPQSEFVCFLDIYRKILFHTNSWDTSKLLLYLTLTSSLIVMLRELRRWLSISRCTNVWLILIAASAAFIWSMRE